MNEWKALGKKLKRDKRPYLNPKSYEEAYPERVKGREYYRKHPELLTSKKKIEMITEFAHFAVRHIADSVPQWRGY